MERSLQKGKSSTHPQLVRLRQLDTDYLTRQGRFKGGITSSKQQHIWSIFAAAHLDATVPYLTAAKDFHDFLEETKVFGYKRMGFTDDEGKDRLRTYFKELDAKDLFAVKVGGTSLSEVEQMRLSLGDEDINKINRMMRRFTIKGFDINRLSEDQKTIQELMVALPFQSLTRGKDLTLSPQLKSLNSRLINYFDYYVPFLVDGATLGFGELDKFLLMAAWTGDVFLDGLALFIPARLGLTPTSIREVYQANFDRIPFGNIFTNRLALPTSYSFKPHSLPDDLMRHVHPDRENSQIVAKRLKEYYQKEDPKIAAEPGSTVDSLLGRVEKYIRSFSRDIVVSPDKRLKIPLTNHPFLDHIILTSQYGQTLMIIGKFPDGASMLLEVNADRYLYGIPASLRREVRNIPGALSQDVLVPLLEHARQRYPGLEPREIIAVDTKNAVDITKRQDAVSVVTSPKRGSLRLPSIVISQPVLPKTPGSEADVKWQDEAKTDKTEVPQIDKPPFSIVDKNKGLLKGEELKAYIREVAYSLSRNDSRMGKDLELVLEALSRDPFGPGSYNITDAKPIYIDNVRRKPRSFRPDKQHLGLQHPKTKVIRVVHYVDTVRRLVIIDRVVDHNEFDDRFS